MRLDDLEIKGVESLNDCVSQALVAGTTSLYEVWDLVYSPKLVGTLTFVRADAGDVTAVLACNAGDGSVETYTYVVPEPHTLKPESWWHKRGVEMWMRVYHTSLIPAPGEQLTPDHRVTYQHVDPEVCLTLRDGEPPITATLPEWVRQEMLCRLDTYGNFSYGTTLTVHLHTSFDRVPQTDHEWAQLIWVESQPEDGGQKACCFANATWCPFPGEPFVPIGTWPDGKQDQEFIGKLLMYSTK